MDAAGSTEIVIQPEGLRALLGIPDQPAGLVVFAHGSGSGRLSPRNNHVAAALRRAGYATLLADLLTPEEERDRANVFDIGLLAARLATVTAWARKDPRLSVLPVGYFGASTGAGAALVAASRPGADVAAVVSRGGRPDLAGAALPRVTAPTLLLVGGADEPVIGLNAAALEQLTCPKDLVIVPGATHLFEEPGTLDQVVTAAIGWFDRWLKPGTDPQPAESLPFRDRADAGRRLARRLQRFGDEHPVVLALPRGGVPVAYEIARALSAPLDITLVRKIGAPGQPELGIGAVVDGANPQLVLNEEIARAVGATPAFIEGEKTRELQELERRRRAYRGDRPAVRVTGKTAIIVDDGIATGGTVRAVLQALAREQPRRLVLAVPVAPSDTLAALAPLANETVCLATPEPFYAIGLYYEDFSQTSDEEVIDLLHRSQTFA